jgi:acetyltransferase-like isoleucine patch superfamily enzyme
MCPITHWSWAIRRDKSVGLVMPVKGWTEASSARATAVATRSRAIAWYGCRIDVPVVIASLFRGLTLLPKVIIRLRGALFRLLVIAAGGRCGPGMRIESGFRLRHGFHSGLSFGRDVYFGRCTTIDCLVQARFDVGSNTTFTQGCFVSVVDSLRIGNDVLVGEYCSLRDANHGIADTDIPIASQLMVPVPINIADNVWIGRGVAVLAGSVIGEGSVIGANAVVSHYIPAMSVAVGVPAKVIKLRLPH